MSGSSSSADDVINTLNNEWVIVELTDNKGQSFSHLKRHFILFFSKILYNFRLETIPFYKRTETFSSFKQYEYIIKYNLFIVLVFNLFYLYYNFY